MKKYFLNFIKIFIFFIFLNFCFALIPIKLGFNLTRSVHCIVYLYKPVCPQKEKYFRNELVMFQPPWDFGILGDKVHKMFFLKKIGALSGDYLFCSELGCVVNEKSIGEIPAIDKMNSVKKYIGFIPPGFFAPIGESKRSYDVKFGGIVPINKIRGKVIKCLLKSG